MRAAPKIDGAKLAQLPPELRAQAEEVLGQLEQVREGNPLQGFWPNSKAQYEFLDAKTRTVVALAGNQFGKTTSLVVRSLIECLPVEALPRRLRQFKRFHGPVHGRLVCPSYALVDQNMIPTFRDWTPRERLKGGGFDKAWNSQSKVLTFANGSFIDFLTYETDLDKFGGVRRHFVGYDEPPPRPIRDEGLGRIMRYGGFEMFAFTPLKANTGWLRREIYKKREDPDITLVRGSVYDNTALDGGAREYFLANLPNDLWRRARELGDFVDVGGLIYPDFERCVLAEGLDPAFLRSLDVVVGIDPGIRNAGIVWVGFDGDNTAWVFNEGLLQDKEAREYAEFIQSENRRLGLNPKRVQYVCDPAARSRGQVTATTVMAALAKEGIYANAGQNDHEAGFDQLRTRMQHGRFHVDPRCVGLRDEADDYAAKEPEEGKDDSHLEPIGGNDHRLDALRYACMERVWDPIQEQEAPRRMLGWRPDKAPNVRDLVAGVQKPHGPMGSMS